MYHQISEQGGFRQTRRPGFAMRSKEKPGRGSSGHLSRVYKQFYQVRQDWSTGSQTVVPGLLSATTAGNLLGMQILRSHRRPTESETVGMGLSNQCLSSHLRGL